MAGYVDIHSHVLPGVDDGSPSVEVSLAMLEVAIGQGVGAMVLTPHLRPFDGPEKEEEHYGRFADCRRPCAMLAWRSICIWGWRSLFVFNMPEVAEDLENAYNSQLTSVLAPNYERLARDFKSDKTFIKMEDYANMLQFREDEWRKLNPSKGVFCDFDCNWNRSIFTGLSGSKMMMSAA